MAKERKKKEVAPEKELGNGETKLHYVDSRDVGDKPFDKKKPLQIQYTLFGKEKEVIECSGGISAVIVPCEKGGVEIVSSVMGITEPDVLLAMMKSLVEHIAEVLVKTGQETGMPMPKIMTMEVPMKDGADIDDMMARAALSRAAVTKTHH